MDAHVLDDAEHGDIDLLEHLEALARVCKGDVLRRCHNNGTGDGYSLCEGKLDVPSAGGHVDDEVVERAPLSLGQKLRQRLGDHGTPPDHRLILVREEETDGHGYDAMRR